MVYALHTLPPSCQLSWCLSAFSRLSTPHPAAIKRLRQGRRASFSEFSEWLNDGWVGGSINRCGCGYSRLLSLQTILGVGIEQDTKCMAIIKVIMFIAANDIGGREKPGYHT